MSRGGARRPGGPGSHPRSQDVRTFRLLGLVSLGLVAAQSLSCSGELETASSMTETPVLDDIDLEARSLAADFRIYLLQTIDRCAQLEANFHQAPTPTGKTLVRYALERRRRLTPTGSKYTPWATVNTTGVPAGKLTDKQFIAGYTYEYRVRPFFKSTGSGAESSGAPTPRGIITPDCKQPRSQSGVTHTIDVYLFRPRDVSPPVTRSHVERLLFSEELPKSLYNYMQDVSAGAGHTAFIPQVRIGGTVHEWRTLKKDASGYAKGLKDMRAETVPFQAELNAADPRKYYLFIFATGMGGGEAAIGGNVLVVGANELQIGPGIGTIAHELGHSLALRHEIAVHCPGDSFPPDLAAVNSVCHIGVYSSPYNVMSGAAAGNYYNGLQKLRLGFLTVDNVAWLDVRELAAGESRQYQLYTSTSAQNRTATQLIMLKVDDADTSFVLQYRHAFGFDTQTFAWASVTETVPFPEGVFVYLWPGFTAEPFASSQGALLFTHPPSVNSRAAIVSTEASSTFYDPHRRIEVSVSRMTHSAATVLVRRR